MNKTKGCLIANFATVPSLTASALFNYFLRHTEIVSREDVLKKVWDDNGLTSSNSNLNQYLSMLRKTFRHYGVDNIIVTVSRGYLQLNPEVIIEALDDAPPVSPQQTPAEPPPVTTTPDAPRSAHARGMCWYMAGACLLTIALLLVAFSLVGISESQPIALTRLSHSQGTVAKLAMRQPFVLFKGLTFQKLCL
ncbi:winged helix-turn-helix domain-containing protein, partial [Escherichia coli]|uniref:winged helix-turn-helix domain-containing protein n=1 Tax=Escherichia coli TaxID=562 RepID=UPI00233F7DB3